MTLISLPLTYIFFKQHFVKPKNISIQFLRSIFLFLSTVFFFYAISIISMAKALALAFVSPLIVTLLSSLLLKEKVGVHRWTAVFVGFIGALIIIQPGFIKINLATLAGLGTGIAYAAATTLIGRVGAVRASIVTYLIPIVAALLGVLILNEELSFWELFGVFILLLGAWLTTRTQVNVKAIFNLKIL